jgi:hypothetical protein
MARSVCCEYEPVAESNYELDTGIERMNAISMISACSRWCLPGALVAGAWAAVVWADSPLTDDERTAQLARMKQIAEGFEVRVPRGGKQVMGNLTAKRLLRYNDVTRQSRESTLWLWMERDTPCGLMAIESCPDNPAGRRLLYEFVSLSDQKVSVSRGSDWKWDAAESGLQRRPIPDAPEPAAKPSTRLTQAKQLFQRFSAHEKAVAEGRIELRPLANPLYRYSDDATGVLDAAVFAFVNGTNPEVLLVIDARRGEQNQVAAWGCSLAQMTGAEVSASLGQQEVWTQTEADPPAARGSYVNGWMPAADEKK